MDIHEYRLFIVLANINYYRFSYPIPKNLEWDMDNNNDPANQIMRHGDASYVKSIINYYEQKGSFVGRTSVAQNSNNFNESPYTATQQNSDDENVLSVVSDTLCDAIVPEYCIKDLTASVAEEIGDLSVKNYPNGTMQVQEYVMYDVFHLLGN